MKEKWNSRTFEGLPLNSRTLQDCANSAVGPSAENSISHKSFSQLVRPPTIQLAMNHSVSWSVPRQFNQPQIIQSEGQSPDNSISHKSFSQKVSPQTIQSATNYSVSWPALRQFNQPQVIHSDGQSPDNSMSLKSFGQLLLVTV